ncbi:hypothetical protein EVAR_41546_1 [Eumeta japonica]|uniref:Uncharacterized protein n=1 Tax=Eumeta variegata TaxID=151549 RepID=A0A4C1X2C2_EUMVA|nr:hypothetical protein EVAR_41546_1 [Eumeta japonica]
MNQRRCNVTPKPSSDPCAKPGEMEPIPEPACPGVCVEKIKNPEDPPENNLCNPKCKEPPKPKTCEDPPSAILEESRHTLWNLYHPRSSGLDLKSFTLTQCGTGTADDRHH